MKPTLRKSLDELEPAAPKQSFSELLSDLAARCAALRSKALQDYSIEDLRLSIRQNIGLTWLVPLALVQLQQQILAEGDCYPGDLLTTVSQVPASYWQEQPAMLKGFLALLQQLPASPPASMPTSVFREVQHRLVLLTALLA